MSVNFWILWLISLISMTAPGPQCRIIIAVLARSQSRPLAWMIWSRIQRLSHQRFIFLSVSILIFTSRCTHDVDVRWPSYNAACAEVSRSTETSIQTLRLLFRIAINSRPRVAWGQGSFVVRRGKRYLGQNRKYHARSRTPPSRRAARFPPVRSNRVLYGASDQVYFLTAFSMAPPALARSSGIMTG